MRRGAERHDTMPKSKTMRQHAVTPTIFQIGGYRFFFLSNEGNPREPIYVHVRKDGNRAKFWVSPAGLPNNRGFSGKEMNRLAQIVEMRRDEIERAWHEHFGDQARL